jgi:hypothetical protein
LRRSPGLEALAQRQKLMVRTLTSRAAQYRDAALTVQQRRQPIEILSRGHHHRESRQQTLDLGRRRVGCGLQRDVAGHHHHRGAALADRLADRDLQRARHLVGTGDEFAVVAALLEQRLRVGFLEIAGADFRPTEFARRWRARARATCDSRTGR